MQHLNAPVVSYVPDSNLLVNSERDYLRVVDNHVLHTRQVPGECRHRLLRERVPQQDVTVHAARRDELVLPRPVERVHALVVPRKRSRGHASLDVCEADELVERARRDGVEVGDVPRARHPVGVWLDFPDGREHEAVVQVQHVVLSLLLERHHLHVPARVTLHEHVAASVLRRPRVERHRHVLEV